MSRARATGCSQNLVVQPAGIDVDMWRLVGLVAVEVEAVATPALDGGHGPALAVPSTLRSRAKDGGVPGSSATRSVMPLLPCGSPPGDAAQLRATGHAGGGADRGGGRQFGSRSRSKVNRLDRRRRHGWLKGSRPRVPWRCPHPRGAPVPFRGWITPPRVVPDRRPACAPMDVRDRT